MENLGTLISDGGVATLHFERTFRHPPERVWQALTTEEGLRAWLMCTFVSIDPREGGTIELVSGAGAYHSRGAILRWQPPSLLEYEWNVAPVPEMPRGEQAIFRYELVRHGESTLLLVTYRRITAQTARGFLPGTHAFLDRLEAQLDARPLPDFLARFAELRGHYPVWQDHAPAAGE